MTKDRVWIGCGGGFFHWGFIAFAEGQEEKQETSAYFMPERLIEGLWMFSG